MHNKKYTENKVKLRCRHLQYTHLQISHMRLVPELSIVNALNEFVNMEKIGHRYVIQYFHLKGLSPTNIKAELDSSLEEPTLLFTTI